MAHRALTLKYRPQVFSDLIGQDHVSTVLGRALDTGRVAHAFLFTGARGVGKTTSARILAKALNCTQRKAGSGADPCNACISCTEITTGVSLDVIEIDGASNRGIADVQQLRENVRFAPTAGKYRVVIIDEVHQLSGDAFAALLKTLEEPPAHLVFIFATTDPQKLPDTIRSRTQRFDFARVATRKVADRLLDITRREATDADGVKFALTEGAALLIAHKGEGSMRDSVSALDQVVSAGEPRIDEDLVRRVLGIPDREQFFRLAEAITQRDPAGTLQALHSAFERGMDPRELAEGVAQHFRDVLVVKIDPERGGELVAASSDDLARLAAQGNDWSEADLLRLMRIAAECQWPMRDSPQPLVHLEAALMQMATLEASETLAALLDRLEGLERKLGGAPAAPRPAPPAAARPVPPSAPRPVPPAPRRPAATQAPAPGVPYPGIELDGTIEAQWRTAVAAVNKQKRMIGAFLEESRLKGVSGNVVLLATDTLHRAVVDVPENLAMINEELQRAFGRPLELRCVALTPGDAAKRPSVADVQPRIDRAIEFFDGEVIDRDKRGGDRT
ncbi:MAG: DNA polymerase III subunit gamma/tau [Candidatus Eisenbacteria bacterium]